MKFLVLGGVVGAVVGLAYNGAKHMGALVCDLEQWGVCEQCWICSFFVLEGVR
ncbi:MULTISPECIES: hypothetical protein [unclassified Bartonella]|uniref:hypothetical protein n=1 Tax=unclassified Bartonella TaxID=2645622 RepID=UPI0035D0C6D6